MQFVPSSVVQWLKSQWHPKSWTFSGNFLVIYSLLFSMKTVYYFISIHFGIIMVRIIVYIIDFTRIKYTEELKITAIHKALSPIHKALNSGVWLELQRQGVLLRKALNREPRSRPLTCMCVCVSFSVLPDSATPWTVASQASLSMEFSRQEYWSRLPFPTPLNLYTCQYFLLCEVYNPMWPQTKVLKCDLWHK